MPYYHTKTRGARRPGTNFRNAHRGHSAAGNRRGPKKDYIDPSRFIKAAHPVQAEAYVPEYNFEDFAISSLIKDNLKHRGFVKPSPIQDKTIPEALKGRDIIGVADTGTGKTAAFAIPLLHKALTSDLRALVIAPTRELAQQIDEELRVIAKGGHLKGAVLIGGASMGVQLRNLRQNPQIVVGTPGRIKDHLERGSLNLGIFGLVVLDEVDRMLDMGFVHDVSTILGQLRPEHQSLFFSATLDARVSTLIQSFSNDPMTISVKSGDTSDNVHQDVVRIDGETDKLDKLHDLLISDGVQKVIIFDDTQRSVDKLSLALVARGFKADSIHGGKSQGQRQRSLNKFKQSELDILVATDVAARGIDVSDITHVINYSTPNSYADYIHRIGRAGRAGKVGYAFTFIER